MGIIIRPNPIQSMDGSNRCTGNPGCKIQKKTLIYSLFSAYI